MNLSPFLRQLFVASAPQLAAISVGGIVGFPGILLPQLKANDSSIHVDVDTVSWIGSSHGLAGALTCLVPLLMQYKGRKLSFILSCLIGFVGWIIVYFAQSAVELIVAEIFHGLSINSILSCSLSTISEMVHPRYRITSMNMYFLGQSFGMNLALLLGRYLSWRTVALIECCPIIVALLICLAWPESPAWLAYKGEFEKCEAAFKQLRGKDADSVKELNDLIRAHKEILAQRKATTVFKLNKHVFDTILLKIKQRDFYLPCLHMFILYCALIWSGMSAVVLYAMNLLHQVTGSESAASAGIMVIYSIIFFGNAFGLVLIKYCKNKTVILAGGAGVSFFMILACISSYLKNLNVIPSDSLLCMYCLIGYTVSFNLGADTCILSVATELMPVKHRGVGGAIYVIVFSLLDFTSLKLSPYLFVYINPWGTFLVFATNAILCIFFIWRYIPETKNRTLQEIEDYYNHGDFGKRCSDDDNLENMNDSNTND